MTDILVFKTNISRKNDLEKVADRFYEDHRIKQWNVDREDIDKVLRIEARHLPAIEVIQLVNEAGYSCEELPD